jgi:hypothetical protein
LKLEGRVGICSRAQEVLIIPLIGTLVVLGGLIALAQFSAVAPFIYTLF